MRATTSSATRGCIINVSTNGSAYFGLATNNVANNRSSGLEQFNIDTTGLETDLSTVDFRIYSTGGGIEYTDFNVIGFSETQGSSPEFTIDPIIKADATWRQNYSELSQTLAGKATDPDAGDVLTYSVLAGPTWLNVDTNGDLSGIVNST